MKILDKVFLVGGADYRLSSGCNVYLIDAGGDLFLMDIGGNADVEDVLRNVREEGFDPGDVSALFVTHEHGDHGGGAKRAKEAFHCETLAHILAAEALGEAFIDTKLSGGERIVRNDVEVIPIHTPGHSPGSMCYRVRMGGKELLFPGGTVFTRAPMNAEQMGGYPIRGWLRSMDSSSWEVYTKSLRKLTEESHPEALFPGHGCFVLREGTDALREAIEAILAVGLRT